MSDRVPFFNIIRLPEGKEEEAMAAWKEISDLMEAQPSCLSTRLHRNKRNPSLLINNAIYTSEEEFLSIVKSPEFQALSQVLTDLGVEREAGVYEVISSFTKDED